MKVVFESPKSALDKNGNKIWENGFDPTNAKDFSLIPNEPGIYIYGINLKCTKENDLNNKFMPLYIGISNNLRNRLFNHYKGLNTSGNGKKEIFDLSSIQCNVNNILNFYSDMDKYDKYRSINPNRFALNSLIWFNNSLFFDSKLAIKGCSKYVSNSGVQNSIKDNGDLDSIQKNYPNCKASALKNKIIDTKLIYNNQFYFFYVKLSIVLPTINSNHPLYGKEYIWEKNRKREHGKFVAEIIEHTAKEKFKNINIYTTAEAKRHSEKMELDLSNVQNEIINLTGKDFSNPLIL